MSHASDLSSSSQNAIGRTFRLLVGISMMSLVVACGGSGGDSVSMPALESKRLDVAMSDLKAQGVEEDDVEVIGGGTFGVIDESNWTVCSQDPATGTTVDTKVRLTVDRSCDDKDPAAESEKSAEPEEAKTEESEPQKSDTFTMPNLVGMVLQDAQDELQSRGSYLMQQVDATGAHRPKLLDSNWQVCAQSPKPGAKTPVDAIVRLEAVKLRETCP